MEELPYFKPTLEEEEVFTLLRDVINIKSPTTVLYLVGGIIRDRLLGIKSSDVDIAVSNMTGEQFCKLIEEYQKDRSFNYKEYTVIKANPDQSKHLETAMMNIYGINIDFVNLRKENYTDSRIPTMEFGTAEEDAMRRDLTINALFYNINTGEMEDFVGGMTDLELRIARTPIDPVQTFIDDPLRILRVIRFAAKYDLTVDPEIIYACHNQEVRESLETKVSPERIWKEIGGYQLEDGSWKCGFFATHKAHIALELIHKMKIDDILFGFEQYNFYQAFYNLSISKNKVVLDDKARLILNMAIIFNNLSLYGNEFDKLFNVKLKVSKEIFQRIKSIISESSNFCSYFYNWNDEFEIPDDKSIRLFLSKIKNDWKLALILFNLTENNILNTKKFELTKKRTEEIVLELGGWKVQCPISGKHLIEIGFPADNSISKALEQLNDYLLEYPKLTKEEALKFCKKFKSNN